MVVIRIADGAEIGAAEAGCFYDETIGRDRKRRWYDRHAVKSMCQTRAASKALAQVLRFIPVLAGYSGTPQEEMPRDMPNGGDLTGGEEKPTRPDRSAAARESRPARARASRPARAAGLSEKEADELNRRAFVRAKSLLGIEGEVQDERKGEWIALANSIKKRAREVCKLPPRGSFHAKRVADVRQAIDEMQLDQRSDGTVHALHPAQQENKEDS